MGFAALCWPRGGQCPFGWLIIAGVVICGFSISDMVERVSFRLDEARENHRYRKEERALAKEEALYAANAPQPAKKQGRRGANNQSSLFDETGEGETTYLGNRKTSVIKRDARLYEEEEAQEDAGDAPTTLIDKAKNKLRSKKKDQSDDAVVEKKRCCCSRCCSYNKTG